MAFYVLKIKYESNLRRLSLEKKEVEIQSFSFPYLETQIRELLQLPATSPLAITYTDEENDVITMGSDQDLKDALVEQGLNPLRIHVTLLKSKSDATGETRPVELEAADAVFKGLLPNPETMKQAFQSVEPFLESWVKSPETVLQNIAAMSSKFTSAVKNGSAAAAASASGTPLPRWGAFQPQPHMQRPNFGDFPAGAGPSGTSEGVDSESPTTLTVHHGVICDACGLSPIVGNRWKSIVKSDYDLCSGCYEKNGNEKEYAKIEQPKFRSRHRYGPLRMGPPPVPSMDIPPPFHPMSRHGHFHGGRPFGMRGPFVGFGGRHHCSPSSGEKLYARFVCDVTVFDGTEVAPGTHFVKIWRVRNSGTAPWPVNTTLVFVGGDELGHVASVPLEIAEQGLAPEAEMEVSVDMVAPEKPGRYVSHWRLASPAGPKFGQRLSVVIQVWDAFTFFGFGHLRGKGYIQDAAELEKEQLLQKDIPSAAQNDESGVVSIDCAAELEKEQLLQKNIPSAAQNDESGVVSMNCDGAHSGEFGTVNAVEEEFGITDVEDKATENATPTPSAAEENVTRMPSAAELFRVEEEKRAEPKISEASPVADGSITYPVLEVTQDEGPITYPVVDAEVAGAAAPEEAVVDAEVAGAAAPEEAVVDAAVAAAAEPEEAVANAAVAGVVEPEESEDLTITRRQLLLRKLEAMGFTDSQLNYELLEKNGNDMRKTLDDLCIAEEWDPMLEELEEMGFYDSVTNRRLMFKNNGSVKRVVKELVEMYRDAQRKGGKLE